jgi:hypothetical protein
VHTFEIVVLHFFEWNRFQTSLKPLLIEISLSASILRLLNDTTVSGCVADAYVVCRVGFKRFMCFDFTTVLYNMEACFLSILFLLRREASVSANGYR